MTSHNRAQLFSDCPQDRTGCPAFVGWRSPSSRALAFSLVAFVAYARGFADAATVVNATVRRIAPVKPVVAVCDRLDDDIDELSPDVAEMLVDSVRTTDGCVCAKKT